MPGRILLCTDLDRTLLPNGHPPESPGVRTLFRTLVDRPEVILAYVSGRNRPQIMEAISQYGVPLPDWAICDVGATIFRIEKGTWSHWEAWNKTIAPAWRGLNSWQIDPFLQGIPGIWKQPEANQNTHKLSYHADPESDGALFRSQIEAILLPKRIHTTIVWSIDDLDNIGMLDIMPEGASKRHAIEFVMAHLGLTPEEILFAGDSGNDLDVLCSPLPSVLVANARETVRREALQRTRIANHPDSLYLAQGGLRGLNGNYAAGILEGLVHYYPDTAAWF
ncbi:MAG: HAD-IIB family hydrolase [Magnetococcales bacterium]|nr:HAD-IIB family hydrolase [Magnetococcales bacterium]